LYMKGIQILVIDPEGEYLDYAKAMGGEIIQFSRDNGINPFSVYSTKSNLRNDILDHIGALKSFFKFFVRPERFDATELDDILMDIYEDYPAKKPTFKVFLEKLKGSSMYRDIAVLEKGSLQGVFNSERELELGNDLVVFDISSLKDTDMKAPAMYLLTSLIWQLVDKKREKKKMLFIDEAHNLLVDREVAVFYRKVVKEARKRNLGVVSITQNVEDFLDSEWGNGIITNSETKILLKQSYASLPLMEKIAPMTEDERMMLGNLPIGDFIMLREQEHIQAYMHVLPFERKFVFTNPGNREDDESTD
ncbi:MAG: VirB4 family type IV secretion system protein, partial [Candidatus Levyibacteriota bacterium]